MHRIRILASTVPLHEKEWSPEIGMRMLLAQIDNCVPESAASIVLCGKVAVEELHELGRAPVVDLPQAEKQRLRASGEETPFQSEQFISFGYQVQARCAAAQGHQSGGQAKLIQIVEGEAGVGEAYRGE